MTKCKNLQVASRGIPYFTSRVSLFALKQLLTSLPQCANIPYFLRFGIENITTIIFLFSNVYYSRLLYLAGRMRTGTSLMPDEQRISHLGFSAKKLEIVT